MSFRKFVAALVVASTLPTVAFLTGCAEAPPASGIVYVETAPPPAQIEVVGVAPSVEHVWIPGHHQWSGHAYVWTSGRWEVRPRAHARYVPGKWRKHHGRWYWVEGYWH